MSRTIGVVITDGVGFRNFVLSDFISESQKRFEKVVIFSCLPKQAYDNLNLNCEIVELEVFEETFKTWFFRKAKELAHLQLHKKGNFGISDNLKANYSRAKNVRGYATRFLMRYTGRFHSEKWIQFYNTLQQITFRSHLVTEKYTSLLKDYKVDILFFTHQRPPFIAPLIYAAEKLKIKTAAFIFSWDNLASKGRMAGNFDYYLVWSELMKTELLHFYKLVSPERVAIVGTPQFEPYVLERYEISQKYYFEKFGLNPELKTICFSCGDISTSKNDELYIETVATAIQENKIETVNFLVRTSPAEDPIRFNNLAKKYPFIKWNFPKWELSRKGHQEAWSQRVPTVEDVKDLRAILQYSDVGVNMLSTMSLDFMQFDKPVINPVLGNAANGLYDDQRFLKYAHIKTISDTESTRIVKNEETLIQAINYYLANPKSDSNNRERFKQLHIGKPLNGTSKRITDALCCWR